MKPFLKENFVLVLGISLPVILIIVFMLAQSMTKLVDPPQYSAVFVLENNHNNDMFYKFKVKNNKLVVTYKKPDKEDKYNANYNYRTSLYIFDPVKDDVEEITLETPENAKDGKWVNVTVPNVKDLQINPAKESPDGYIFEEHHRRNSNIFSDIFGYYSGKNRYALTKQGRHVPIKNMSYTYGRDTFIGWVVKGENGQ